MSTTFAVIITNYNYKQFVCEAVDCALAQTRAPAQIIVVDDGSNDGSPDLLRERYGDDNRVTMVFCENGGQLAAFQQGLGRVDADVVCFLDADDLWKPDYLDSIGKIYDARGDVDFIFTDLLLFGNETGRSGEADHAIDYGYTAISTYALANWYGGPTSALSMRSLLANRCVDLPQELSATWRLCADAALVYGASLLGGRKYFIPLQMVMYRVHGSNGWWSNRGATANYRNRIRARALIDLFARRAGLSDRTLESVKFEYRTKKGVNKRERRRYVNIAMSSPGPLWKRFERAMSVFFDRKARVKL